MQENCEKKQKIVHFYPFPHFFYTTLLALRAFVTTAPDDVSDLPYGVLVYTEHMLREQFHAINIHGIAELLVGLCRFYVILESVRKTL